MSKPGLENALHTDDLHTKSSGTKEVAKEVLLLLGDFRVHYEESDKQNERRHVRVENMSENHRLPLSCGIHTVHVTSAPYSWSILNLLIYYVRLSDEQEAWTTPTDP